MKSFILPEFWRLYRDLTPDLRQQAREAYREFAKNPYHPSLHFKPLRGFDSFWSVRISLSYRSVGRRVSDSIYWFWIGPHDLFDRDFGS